MIACPMAIKWDPVLTRGVAAELSEVLAGQRLRAALFDHAGGALRLYFREGTLDALLRDPGPTLLLGDPVDPPPEARPFPCRVGEVTALPDERILSLVARRIRGKRLRIEVIIELATNRPNAVLAEGDDRIVRHVLMDRARGGRSLRVGYPYQPPDPSERLGIEAPVARAEWLELLLSVPPRERERTLLSRFAYTSRIAAAALLGSATQEDGSGAEASLSRGYDLWLGLSSSTATSPCVLHAKWGEQPYVMPLPGYDSEPAASLLEVLGEMASERVEGSLPSVLVSRLQDEAKRAARAAASLHRRLENTPDPAAARGLGDLILARIHEVPRGAESVELEGFDGTGVVVELDPRKSPSDNAARYYGEAAKGERALEKLPGLVADARLRSDRLEALLVRVRTDDVTADEVREALPQVLETTTRAPKVTALPYRLYESSGGLEIRVGRGARFNDDLTFHHSRPRDIWLHARHTAGAHVILRWDSDDNPPARDLEEAAILAALYSKARTSSSVPVDWTRRKHVRKPRKAPRGMVSIDHVGTVFVEPDPAVEERLAPKGSEPE